MIVNGKEYPLWSQFVEKKDEWIGGILEELEDSFPRLSMYQNPDTLDPLNFRQQKITDIRLEPNGKDNAYFSVDGEDYSCGGSTDCLGICPGEEGWITLSGY